MEEAVAATTPPAMGLVATFPAGLAFVFAVVGAAAVAVEVTGGACRSARVVLGGVAPLPVVVESVEEAVAGRPPVDATWREVGELGAGQRSVVLGRRQTLPAGVYLVRLTQDRQSVTARAIVVQ